MTGPALLACDWGTTNLRAWTLDSAGEVVARARFDLGVSRLAPGEAARRFHDEVRPALAASGLPAILCGMIGSDIGWSPAPYAPCPADITAVARGMMTVEPRTLIVPGLVGPGITAAPDVMRGEETQVLGWITQAPARAVGRRLICHPGTHAKWVLVEDAVISRFVSAMTGELFALLKTHGLLRHEGAVEDTDAFDTGVDAAGDGGALAARLFSARSRVVSGHAPDASTPAYLSGLLIGAEVAALLPHFPQVSGPVIVLGAPGLTRWYGRAFQRLGVEVEIHDGERAAVAGLAALAAMGGLL